MLNGVCQASNKLDKSVTTNGYRFFSPLLRFNLFKIQSKSILRLVMVIHNRIDITTKNNRLRWPNLLLFLNLSQKSINLQSKISPFHLFLNMFYNPICKVLNFCIDGWNVSFATNRRVWHYTNLIVCKCAILAYWLHQRTTIIVNACTLFCMTSPND